MVNCNGVRIFRRFWFCKYSHSALKVKPEKGYFLLNDCYFLDLTNFMWLFGSDVANIL